MASLQEQLTKSMKLKPNKLQNDLFKFVKSIEKELIEIEKKRIFNESKDIQGNDLGFYSSATEKITKGRKKAGEPFTGFETGDFFKAFYSCIFLIVECGAGPAAAGNARPNAPGGLNAARRIVVY